MPKLLYRPDDVSSDDEPEPEPERAVATQANVEPKVIKKATTSCKHDTSGHPDKKEQGWSDFVNDGLEQPKETKEAKQTILEPVPSYGCTHCNMRFKRAHNLNAHLNRCSVVLAVNKLREEKLAKAELNRAKREMALKKKLGDDSVQFKAVGRPPNPKPKIGRPAKPKVVVVPVPEPLSEPDETDCESESEPEPEQTVRTPVIQKVMKKDAPPPSMLNPFLGNVTSNVERNPRFSRYR